MSNVIEDVVTATTIADGSTTAYSSVLTGVINRIVYVKSTFADGVDFTITTEKTGQTVWTQINVNASATVYPTAAASQTDGTADPMASRMPIAIANDRLIFAIAQGGNAKVGTFRIVMW